MNHRAETKHGGGLRWRDRPRLSIWVLSRSYGYFVVLLGGAWVGFAVFGWAALSGRLAHWFIADQSESPSRWFEAGLAATFLAPAVVLTRVLVLFVRRPVLGSKSRPGLTRRE